ncbi:DUF2948 family protein [Salinarimonas ramus]|uniref:DUF2948 family protein n=1 Tax=Salinarimonas ramus TaxID=690164 RepID=A0A917V5D3_9HYPH|nr:DUF2948 family protein [Salinarimonas ramus]GGK42189.1 hypothetical protein GCM10011322_31680 [Salinarimonas ramus]
MDLLKLVAFDEEDLAVLSAHLQDAAVRVEDVAYLPKEGRFALCARRFDWESDLGEAPRRRLTGIHFERVQNVRCKNMDPRRKEEVLNLLAVTFEPGAAPAGCVTLIFSEDRAIRLDVECLEAQMKDMGPVWEVESRPEHAAPDPLVLDAVSREGRG